MGGCRTDEQASTVSFEEKLVGLVSQGTYPIPATCGSSQEYILNIEFFSPLKSIHVYNVIRKAM